MADPNKVASVKEGSVQALVTALVTNAGILLVEVGAFMILRRHIRKIYAPRTYLPPPRRRSQPIGKGYLSWIPAIIKTPATEIIHKNGLDAYFFLRFLRVLLKIFAVTTVVAFAVLVPVNIVHRTQSQTGYQRIAWGNIPDEMSKRYSAHVAVSYVLAFYIFYLLRQELMHLVSLRHSYLISKHHSRRAQARTVLVTGIPKNLLTEKNLREFTSFVPGGVNNIWIYRESKILSELFEDRQKACEKLETAVTQVLRRATKVQNTRAKTALEKGVDVPYPAATRALLDELVPPGKRPQHRLGMLGLVGKKVDTIEWAKAVIPDLDRRISAARHDLPHVEPAGSAFIEFNLQIGAHVMDQCVSYHEPLKMADKWVEVAAEDIVWANIDDGSYETRARFAISWIATIALIVGYAPLVTFAGTISNISTWCTRAPWLAWICKAPDVAIGLIQGVVPPLVIAILFFLVPFFLRALAWFECVPRYTLVSQRVYTRYFVFLVIHGFIVTTLSSSLIAAIPQVLDRPSEAVRMLANNLPKASTYFLTYIISTGFTGAGMAFLQLVPLVLHYVKKWLFGRTPREAYSVSFIMPALDFGVVIPPISLLATIGLSYSVISPLMNVVAVIASGLLWFAYKYLFLYVMDQPEQNETGGLYYPKAISNLFAGLYIQQVTVAGLLFLRIGIDGAEVTSAIQGAFMVLLVFLTFGAQVMLHNSFDGA
ncbi:DUF221-domain-containing protein [Auricularia subglabra TFB-10046 SS5]|nr:DUF221-domain-containing protein [Auricularia subglabra TFB-10046 SS5]